jgi:hypothetical protein
MDEPHESNSKGAIIAIVIIIVIFVIMIIGFIIYFATRKKPIPPVTPPGYTPPNYTPPSYTPPSYTPPSYTPPVSNVCQKIRINRSYNSGGKHIDSTPSSLSQDMKSFPNLDTMQFYCCANPIANTIPIYRKFASSANDHMSTEVQTEGDNLGYTADFNGQPYCYIYKDNSTDSTLQPLYRKFNSDLTDHMTTLTSTEGAPNYVLDRTMGYVYTS